MQNLSKNFNLPLFGTESKFDYCYDITIEKQQHF